MRAPNKQLYNIFALMCILFSKQISHVVHGKFYRKHMRREYQLRPRFNIPFMADSTQSCLSFILFTNKWFAPCLVSLPLNYALGITFSKVISQEMIFNNDAFSTNYFFEMSITQRLKTIFSTTKQSASKIKENFSKLIIVMTTTG